MFSILQSSILRAHLKSQIKCTPTITLKIIIIIPIITIDLTHQLQFSTLSIQGISLKKKHPLTYLITFSQTLCSLLKELLMLLTLVISNNIKGCYFRSANYLEMVKISVMRWMKVSNKMMLMKMWSSSLIMLIFHLILIRMRIQSKLNKERSL